MNGEKKRRSDVVKEIDVSVEVLVHDGKGYVKVKVPALGRGKKWGEFVKTRKVRSSKKKGSAVRKGSKTTKGKK